MTDQLHFIEGALVIWTGKYLQLAVYILGLVGTGYLSFFNFIGLTTFAPPDMIRVAKDDPERKRDMLTDIARSRDEKATLVDLAAHSFDVLLGALLGFLSAAPVSAGIGRPREESSPPAESSEPKPDQNAARPAPAGPRDLRAKSRISYQGARTMFQHKGNSTTGGCDAQRLDLYAPGRRGLH
jgi:hypothetical protein